MSVFSCPRPNSSTYIVELAISLTHLENHWFQKLSIPVPQLINEWFDYFYCLLFIRRLVMESPLTIWWWRIIRTVHFFQIGWYLLLKSLGVATTCPLTVCKDANSPIILESAYCACKDESCRPSIQIEHISSNCNLY